MLKRVAKKIDIFRGLEPLQYDELLSWFEKRKYREGEDIFKEDQESVGLYLLCQGTVGVTKKSEKGRFRLANLEAPSFFGEMGLLVEEGRSATVRARTDVVVGQLSRQVFKDKLRQDNLTALTVSLNIARLLTTRLIQADEEIARLKAKVTRMQQKTAVKGKGSSAKKGAVKGKKGKG